MNKKQYDELEKSLKESGYKMYNNPFNNADYYLCKSLHKADNRWDEGRSALQILLYIKEGTP